MNEIKVAENKTLKLTNVLSRVVQPEELANLPVILTQMQNFMKSNGAQPIGPLVQAIVEGTGPDHMPVMYMMQQATQMITQMEPGYHMDAVLRVKNCLYAHFTGPLAFNQLPPPSCRSWLLKTTSSLAATATPSTSIRTRTTA